MFQLVRTVAVALLALIACLALQGCTSLDQVEKLRNDLSALHEKQEQHAKAQQEAAAALPIDDPNKQLIEASAAAASAQAAATKAALITLQEILSKAQHPEQHPDTSAIGVLTQLLPAPWRVPLVMGGAVLATLARAVQLKRGLVSVAKSIEQAKKFDKEFLSTFGRNTPIFEAVQTPAAKRVVLEATSPNLMFRLPV